MSVQIPSRPLPAPPLQVQQSFLPDAPVQRRPQRRQAGHVAERQPGAPNSEPVGGDLFAVAPAMVAPGSQVTADSVFATPADEGGNKAHVPLVALELDDVVQVEVTPVPAIAAVPPTNLLATFRAVAAHPTAPERLVHDMRSALNGVSKVFGQPLERITSDPGLLRDRLNAASPASAGISPARWARICSLVTRALALTGVAVLPSRYNTAMTTQWALLHEALPTRKLRIGLSRMLRYFSQAEIEPHQVTSATLARFQADSAAKDLRGGTPHINSTFRLWNAAIDAVALWPAVVAPIEPDARRYALPIDQFPASFVQDLARFITQKTEPNVFADDYAGPVQASTASLRRYALIEVASALVASGFPIERVTGLHVVVDPANAQAALKYLYERRGCQKGRHLAQQATTLLTVGKHYVHAPADHLAHLKRYAKNVMPTEKGMTERNRARLRQFDLDANVAALLYLPQTVLRQAGSHKAPTRKMALRIMKALAVALLTVAPLRVNNLRSLELDRHIIIIRRGKQSTCHIVVPAAETKTRVPFEKKLSPQTRALLDCYLTHYRPLICKEASPLLFPSWENKKRVVSRFSGDITKFIYKETGLRMNVHLFRHFAGKMRLSEEPGDIETVRQILGHTTTATTLRCYADIITDHAFQRYEDTIAKRRAQLSAPPVRRKTPKKEK